jgi:hypothetical protein
LTGSGTGAAYVAMDWWACGDGTGRIYASMNSIPSSVDGWYFQGTLSVSDTHGKVLYATKVGKGIHDSGLFIESIPVRPQYVATFHANNGRFFFSDGDPFTGVTSCTDMNIVNTGLLVSGGCS